MCGIAGIVNLKEPVSRFKLSRMSGLIEHRGPDDRGEFFFETGNIFVGLASRRLSILDLSLAGHMPMANKSNTLWLVYNGEIYNHSELGENLRSLGYSYNSKSDTETLLYAFEEYGLDCFQQFNGMFAAAFYDVNRDMIVLARDRMGIKPLYYSWDGQELVFASELKAFDLEAVHPATELNPDALNFYLTYGYVPAPLTMYRGVHKLPAGSLLILQNGEIRLEKYWEARFKAPVKDKRSTAELVELTRETVENAVKRQLISDVPVGILLSGGLDSAIIAAVAQKYTSGPINTFSVGFETTLANLEPFYNHDLQYAAEVANQLGTIHHQVLITDGPELIRDLQELQHCLDEPVWEQSFLSIFALTKLAREKGVKVVLTGDGSDELWGGYPWYSGALRLEKYEKIPLLPHLLVMIAKVFAGQSLGLKAQDLLAKYRQTLLVKYEVNYSYISQEGINLVLAPEMQEQFHPGFLEEFIGPFLEKTEGSLADRFALTDLELWVGQHFNQRVDRMSMANSVEARVPFQDNAVIDLALTISMERKIQKGVQKYLLREAFRDILPECVLQRPKRPFAAPGKAWLEGALNSCVSGTTSSSFFNNSLFEPSGLKTILDKAAQKNFTNSYEILVLLNLQFWLQSRVKQTA